MPTFILFRNREKVDEVVGANAKALRAAIEKLTVDSEPTETKAATEE